VVKGKTKVGNYFTYYYIHTAMVDFLTFAYKWQELFYCVLTDLLKISSDQLLKQPTRTLLNGTTMPAKLSNAKSWNV